MKSLTAFFDLGFGSHGSESATDLRLRQFQFRLDNLPLTNMSQTSLVLIHTLSGICTAEFDPETRFELLERVRAPLGDLLAYLESCYECDLIPLPAQPRRFAERTINLLDHVVTGYEQVVLESRKIPRLLNRVELNRRALAIQRAFFYAVPAMRVRQLLGWQLPSESWRKLYRLYLLAGELGIQGREVAHDGEPVGDIESRFRALVLFACLTQSRVDHQPLIEIEQEMREWTGLLIPYQEVSPESPCVGIAIPADLKSAPIVTHFEPFSGDFLWYRFYATNALETRLKHYADRFREHRMAVRGVYGTELHARVIELLQRRWCDLVRPPHSLLAPRPAQLSVGLGNAFKWMAGQSGEHESWHNAIGDQSPFGATVIDADDDQWKLTLTCAEDHRLRYRELIAVTYEDANETQLALSDWSGENRAGDHLIGLTVVMKHPVPVRLMVIGEDGNAAPLPCLAGNDESGEPLLLTPSIAGLERKRFALGYRGHDTRTRLREQVWRLPGFNGYRFEIDMGGGWVRLGGDIPERLFAAILADRPKPAPIRPDDELDAELELFAIDLKQAMAAEEPHTAPLPMLSLLPM